LLSKHNKFGDGKKIPSPFYGILCAHKLIFIKKVCAIGKIAIPLHRRKKPGAPTAWKEILLSKRYFFDLF
jgi:hypothetical protein